MFRICIKSVATISICIILFHSIHLISIIDRDLNSNVISGYDLSNEITKDLVDECKDNDDNNFCTTHYTISRRNPRATGYYESASNGLPTGRPGPANDAGWTGITFGHLNNDNDLDLVCVGRKGSGPEVFLGNGAGSWTKSNNGITSTSSGRSDVRIADLNKDGNNDILSSDSGFWQGDGTGKWSSFPSPLFYGEDVDFGDFNNDSHLDVAIVGHLTGGIHAAAVYPWVDMISSYPSLLTSPVAILWPPPEFGKP